MGGWNKDEFLKIREWDRSDITTYSDIERADRFIILNKLGFRGMNRHNSKGEFNIGWGDYKKPKNQIPTKEKIQSISSILGTSQIVCESYTEALSRVKNGDFVYLDPPYTPIKKNGFTGYAGNGWGENDQFDLLRCLLDLDSKGAKWMLSGHDEPLYRQIYRSDIFPSIKIVEVDVKRSISINGDRTPAKELIIMNYR